MKHKTASINMESGAALYAGWHVFWTALWNLLRHPRSHTAVEFALFEDYEA